MPGTNKWSVSPTSPSGKALFWRWNMHRDTIVLYRTLCIKSAPKSPCFPLFPPLSAYLFSEGKIQGKILWRRGEKGGILTKKKSLEYIIKTYSKSINVEDAVVVEQAKNEFLKLLNEAGYKKNRNNRRYELRSKEQNKEKDTPNFNVDDTNKEDVKIPRKRKTKKEVEEEKDRLEHPYSNMKDDELMKTIFNHAKNTNYKTAVKKPVGIYVYNTVAEKFKYLEEAYFLINNNIIMDTLINIFIIM